MSKHPIHERRPACAVVALIMVLSLAACTGQGGAPATVGVAATTPAGPGSTRASDAAPTQAPSQAATSGPADTPAGQPTDAPTDAAPTEGPTGQVTEEPTSQPSATTDAAPTDEASTDAPTGQPIAPTEVPTEQPAQIATDPAGPDFVLYSLPECAVVPGGQISGADGLTLFVAVRNAGPGDWSQLVTTVWDSDTGLRGSAPTNLSTGSATSALQVDLRPSDYGLTHRFTVVVDPANEVRERDESNNTLQITVSLAPGAAAGGNVPCTSP